ncbi:MAG: LacI family DNA-binding transcriptional regulator [Gammaproteobacteria bacterium]
MSAKVKVSDVAKLAGVSVATVSRTFSSPQMVREKARMRVIEAAQSLGYSPNPAAKALRLQKTHIVGTVIPALDYAIYARMVNSFQQRLTAQGYMVFVLAVGFDNTDLYEPVRLLVERGAEALLMVGRIEDERLQGFLEERKIPVITTYSFHADGPFPSIGFDNYAASKQLVDYLIRLGHQNLVMVAGPTSGNDRQLSRIRAFRDMAEAAAIAGSAHVIEKTYSLPEGAAALRTIRTEFPDTTAIICNSDVLAFGILTECRKLGVCVPGDMTVTGFDDLEFAVALDPPLTTVAVPAHEMGQRTAEALLDAMTSGGEIASVRLETSLIVRSSASNPPS